MDSKQTDVFSGQVDFGGNIPSERKSTYYQVMEVSPSATRAEIRQAYIRLKNTYSSESPVLYSLMSEDEIVESRRRVDEAYRTLNDDLLRMEYDKTIGVAPAATLEPFDLTGELKRRADSAESGSLGSEFEKAFLDGSGENFKLIKKPSNLRLKAEKSADDAVQKAMKKIIDEADRIDGNTLKMLREEAQVSEQEIRDRTKISHEFLAALENNDFKRLPAMVYVRGFIKGYLVYIRAPEAQNLLEGYIRTMTGELAT